MAITDYRRLGQSSLTVAPEGLGCMGMSEFYNPKDQDDAESIRVIHRYLDAGGNCLDTADMYGSGRNEELVGKAIADRRDSVVLATKFANVRGPNGEFAGIRGDGAYVREACDASLKRLKVDVIDLYYQHRVDPKTPIEETVGAMSELVQAGKVRFLGLSEAAAATIRRAVKVHPIAALQTEYSLWSRDIETEILPTIRELGISLVAYSPLGRGFLTGAYQSIDDFPADDYRRNSPRFQGANFARNLDLVAQIGAIARAKNCTPKSACPRLGPPARRRHRPDSRNQADEVPRRQPRRSRSRTDRRRPRHHQRHPANRCSGRRPLPRPGDAKRESLIQSRNRPVGPGSDGFERRIVLQRRPERSESRRSPFAPDRMPPDDWPESGNVSPALAGGPRGVGQPGGGPRLARPDDLDKLGIAPSFAKSVSSCRSPPTSS